ncbi:MULTISPECIES: hypothetical protein [Rahnella]|uniref:Uncharacterized protein n=1 Tax=Rahnella laticis TaxID=2787622 RepID=A0ABS0EAH0_9GAMM|nr:MULTISPECIES: hypothetical protein [Rahnella]MBF7982089.1 hypothetical protein [Rahnella laticis]MBF8002179.1 hypothetical protein [Rahnella sp. LAC-M12]
MKAGERQRRSRSSIPGEFLPVAGKTYEGIRFSASEYVSVFHAFRKQ